MATDAELDHTLGLVLLREARRLQLYATAGVRAILDRDTRLLPVTQAFAQVKVTELALNVPVPLTYGDGQPSGMVLEAFGVPAGPPRFSPHAAEGHTVGLVLEDQATGGSLAFVPGCGELDRELVERLGATDLLLFDGTFWSDDELVAMGIGERRAREMDHLPVSGSDGSLVRLSPLSRPRKVYTHINNTNPMLLEGSPERSAVEAAGLEVGFDGMSFTV